MPILSRDSNNTCLTAADKASSEVIKSRECHGSSAEHGQQALTLGLSWRRRHPLSQIIKSWTAEFHISVHLHEPLSQKQLCGLPDAASLNLLRKLLIEGFSN